MSKTRKILATLTMVAVATTASLTTVSSTQAHWDPWFPVHPHLDPGVVTMPVPPLSPPAHDHSSHHHHENHNHGLRRGEAAALGVLGGVLIGSVLANANRRQARPAPAAALPPQHYIYCDNRYRSYVAATDSFMGYDGYRHRCNSPWS